MCSLSIQMPVLKATEPLLPPPPTPSGLREEVLKENRKLVVEGRRDKNRRNEACRKKISTVGKMQSKRLGLARR